MLVVQCTFGSYTHHTQVTGTRATNSPKPNFRNDSPGSAGLGNASTVIFITLNLVLYVDMDSTCSSFCFLFLVRVLPGVPAESLVVQCRDCQEKVSSVLTHCYAAAEDSGVTGTGTANQQLATSGLEVDMTSFALAFPFVRLCHQKIVLLTAQMACYHYVQSDPTEESRGEVPELLRQHIESFLQYAKHYPLLVPVNVVAVVETLSRLLSSSQVRGVGSYLDLQ